MRGTELRNAFVALEKVENLGHYRPETVHRAVGATLAYIGARRLLSATRNGVDGALERRLLGQLAKIEDAAIRLDAIPQRSEFADQRADVWDEIIGEVSDVWKTLKREEELARLRSSHSASRTA